MDQRNSSAQRELKALRDKYRRRVKKGAKLLDEKHPGWRKEINLDELSMQSTCKCVLAQVFKDFYNPEKLGLPHGWDHGFSVELDWSNPLTFSAGRSRRIYAILDELWKKEIRREQG